ncbi:hypothetical protein ABIB81_008946 [Bradyrhizobium sp. I1.7.5]
MQSMEQGGIPHSNSKLRFRLRGFIFSFTGTSQFPASAAFSQWSVSRSDE